MEEKEKNTGQLNEDDKVLEDIDDLIFKYEIVKMHSER